MDSNVSDSLLDLEQSLDVDENQPPNFVPDTPVASQMPTKSTARASLGELSFVPESQSSPLPTSIIKQKTMFKIPDSPATDLDDSSFLAPSQQPVPIREKPSRMMVSSIQPRAELKEHMPTSKVKPCKETGFVPDSDDDDDMFNHDDSEAIGPTQAVDETETVIPAKTINESHDIILATQAVDETAEETDISQRLGDTEQFGKFGLDRVDTKDLDVLFEISKPSSSVGLTV